MHTQLLTMTNCSIDAAIKSMGHIQQRHNMHYRSSIPANLVTLITHENKCKEVIIRFCLLCLPTLSPSMSLFLFQKPERTATFEDTKRNSKISRSTFVGLVPMGKVHPGRGSVWALVGHLLGEHVWVEQFWNRGAATISIWPSQAPCTTSDQSSWCGQN